MTNKINALNTLESLQSSVELDLLAALLEPEDATYPWNPADPESEAYFSELEQQFMIDDLLDSSIATRSQTFYTQLDNLWSGFPTASVVASIQETLQTAFAAGVPHGWLDAIAQKATAIFASEQSIGDQLVQCVQSVLPTWGVEDLLVLARPYAYAMRSNESQSLASVINNLGNRDWADLSEIEQAKVSLAISYYALTQLNGSQSEI
ncbi:hypothetical protein [Calothrix sp. PCC 7507]|uniref:hypothetical protein n=1 Tax=Calothrix sp. PCC 7507 TaxID=99598 RepID=UPI00029EFEE6|nr:hypothetical protein [Calothrix sp. PCC 7507]AFY32560.1 hypothetical protein Cal7507_2118 [Calothrix sp. PCC 7507]